MENEKIEVLDLGLELTSEISLSAAKGKDVNDHKKCGTLLTGQGCDSKLDQEFGYCATHL